VSTSTQVMFAILFAFGYLVAPIMLIWGWARWLRQPKVRTTPSILSLIGFVLASASALIAFLLIAYAQVITSRITIRSCSGCFASGS